MGGPSLITCLVLSAILMLLLLRARVPAPTCARCGLLFERTALGEPACRCHG